MRDAITLLGSGLRAHIALYFLRNPGPQKDCAAHLGVSRKAISQNVAALVDARVLVAKPSQDKRSEIYEVDPGRLTDLLVAPTEFFYGQDAADEFKQLLTTALERASHGPDDPGIGVPSA